MKSKQIQKLNSVKKILIVAVFMLINLCFATSAFAVDYVIEKPIIGSEIPELSSESSTTPEPVQPAVFDSYYWFSLGEKSYQQGKAIWLTSETYSKRYLEVWSYDGQTRYARITFRKNTPNSDLLGFTDDENYFLFYDSVYNSNYGVYLGRLKAINMVNNTVTTLKIFTETDLENASNFYNYDTVPRFFYDIGNGRVFVRWQQYNDSSGNWQDLYMYELVTLTGGVTELGDYYLSSYLPSSVKVRKDNAGNVYVGTYINTNYRVWRITPSGSVSTRLTIYVWASRYADTDVYLKTYSSGFFLAYREYDEDDEDLQTVRLYKNGSSVGGEYGAGLLFSNTHVGISTSSGTKIYRLTDGSQVFSSAEKEWNGDKYEPENLEQDAFFYDETFKTILTYRVEVPYSAAHLTITKIDLNTNESVALYQGQGWVNDGEKWATHDGRGFWNPNYAYAANNEIYWYDPTNQSIHFALKGTATDINYSDELHKLYTIIDGKAMEVTFSPITSSAEVISIVNSQISSNTKINNIQNDLTSLTNTVNNLNVVEKRATASSSPSPNWYRFAAGQSSGSYNGGLFKIRYTKSGKHGVVLLWAGITYGQYPTINVLGRTSYGDGAGIEKVRLVYGGTYDQPYLELYVDDSSVNIEVEMAGNSNAGWSIQALNSGSIPSDYTTKEINLINSKYSIDSGTFEIRDDGKVYTSGAMVVNGTVNGRNIGSDGAKLDNTVTAVYPVIKNISGLNKATITITSNFTVVIDAVGASEYRVQCNGFDEGWVSSNEVTITGLPLGTYQASAIVQVRNVLGNIESDVFTFFVSR